MDDSGYPQLEIIIDENGNFTSSFDTDALAEWNALNQDSLFVWQAEAEAAANIANPATENFTENFLQPGSEAFQNEFDRIISTPSGDNTGGTRIIDRSALYHLHGEYQFEPFSLNYIKVGANARYYTPESEGTIFVDTVGNDITNFEFGIYAGAEKDIKENLALSATLRMDKNQNFGYLFSPAASLVYTPDENNFLRVSFSSAIRNPTLSDQYLDFNVGPAILRGNLNGVDSLITIDSFNEFRKKLLDADRPDLEFFSIDAIRPEKVKSFEIGYRSTLFEKLFLDASYYYSIYDDFIGFNIGLDVAFAGGGNQGLPTNVQAFRYSANSQNTVTTQGFSIGLNYFLSKYYKLAGNYSWNKLNTELDDPIIPAFNTPEHKFNIGLSGRAIPLNFLGNKANKFGFNINYKWVEGFIFEGSPQFTGFIESYGLLDAQINYKIEKIGTTFKMGASNALNNQVFQTYGGPLVGRLAYASILYEFSKK
jgi:outer membrane receptor protein involved in Fe transport